MSATAATHRLLTTTILLFLVAVGALVPVALGHYLLDLDVYRAAGHAVLTGHDLYAFHVRRYGFTYPPFAALVFTPFASVSLACAGVVLTAISLGCLVLVVRLSAPDLVRRVRSAPSGASVMALVALLVCAPVRATLWNGQINLILGVLVLADLLVLRRGVLVGVAAAMKLTPLIFVLYLLVCGRYREARAAGVTFALAGCGAAVVLPGASWRFWTHALWSCGGIGDMARSDNESLRALALRLVGHADAAPIWVLMAVPAAVAGLWLARRAATGGQEVLAAGIVGVTGCLVSPVSWTHHWIWCVPWLAGMWSVATTRAARGAVLAAGAVFVAQGVVPGRVFDGQNAVLRVLGSQYVLAVLLCCVVAGTVRWCRRRGHSSTGTAARARRFLHSVGVSAKPDLALVYAECQPRIAVRPTGSPAPSVAGTADSGLQSVLTPRVRTIEWPS